MGKIPGWAEHTDFVMFTDTFIYTSIDEVSYPVNAVLLRQSPVASNRMIWYVISYAMGLLEFQ